MWWMTCSGCSPRHEVSFYSKNKEIQCGECRGECFVLCWLLDTRPYVHGHPLLLLPLSPMSGAYTRPHFSST